VWVCVCVCESASCRVNKSRMNGVGYHHLATGSSHERKVFTGVYAGRVFFQHTTSHYRHTQTDRQRYTQRYKDRDTHTDRQTEIQRHLYTHTQRDKHVNSVNRETDRQTDRQTDRHKSSGTFQLHSDTQPRSRCRLSLINQTKRDNVDIQDIMLRSPHTLTAQGYAMCVLYSEKWH